MSRHWVFLVVALLCSGQVIADNPSQFFRTIDKAYVPRVETEIEARNMPPIYDQSGLPFCYAFAATTLMQQLYCRQRNVDCKKLTLEERISPLEAAAAQYTAINSGREGLDFEEGGSMVVGNTLAKRKASLKSEACHNFAHFAKKLSVPSSGYTDSQMTAVRRVIGTIRTQHDVHKNGGNACISCISDTLAEYFDMHLTDDQIKRALDFSFALMLHELFLGSCDKKTIVLSRISEEYREKNPSAAGRLGGLGNLQGYPNNDREFLERKTLSNKELADHALSRIKYALSGNAPVGISGCLIYKNGSCPDGYHMFVIAGYRKVCNTRGDCLDSLQVVNSWGQAWQDRHDNGWVDARYLLENLWKDKAHENRMMDGRIVRLVAYARFPADTTDQPAREEPKAAVKTNNSRFTQRSDTVKDTQTGLTWASLPDEGKAAWDKAAAYCERRGAGWRLPAREELASLLGSGIPIAVEGFPYWLSGSFSETSKVRPCGPIDDRGNYKICPLTAQHRALCVLPPP